MKPRKRFLLRISPPLYKALEAWARRESRSVNGQVEHILKEAARKQGLIVEDFVEPLAAVDWPTI